MKNDTNDTKFIINSSCWNRAEVHFGLQLGSTGNLNLYVSDGIFYTYDVWVLYTK